MNYYLYLLFTTVTWIPLTCFTFILNVFRLFPNKGLNFLDTLEYMVLNPQLILVGTRLELHTSTILFTLPDLRVDISLVTEHLDNMDKRVSFDIITRYSGLEGHLELLTDLDHAGLLDNYQKEILLDQSSWFWVMVNREIELHDSEPFEYKLLTHF